MFEAMLWIQTGHVASCPKTPVAYVLPVVMNVIFVRKRDSLKVVDISDTYSEGLIMVIKIEFKEKRNIWKAFKLENKT